jgi:hypothetical protein
MRGGAPVWHQHGGSWSCRAWASPAPLLRRPLLARGGGGQAPGATRAALPHVRSALPWAGPAEPTGFFCPDQKFSEVPHSLSSFRGVGCSSSPLRWCLVVLCPQPPGPIGAVRSRPIGPYSAAARRRWGRPGSSASAAGGVAYQETPQQFCKKLFLGCNPEVWQIGLRHVFTQVLATRRSCTCFGSR